jgi:catechol 2,3-dioxygenase-like lactoylglutathione lyase family enzyme
MKVNSIDHLVLTVKDIKASCDFYTKGLGLI